MPMVNVAKDVNLYVQDWGKGKPIVLIHGWPLSHRMWEYQASGIVNHGYRVVAIDLRGYGYSDKPWEGNDYDTWASDIGKVIKDRNLHDVTLVGFSMGGAIAMHYVATTNDSRISKLALLAAAGPCLIKKTDNPQGIPRQIWDGFLQAEIQDRAKFKHEFNKSFFNKPVSQELNHWFEAIGMQADAHASLQGLEELGAHDLRTEISTIKIPTRSFHGLKDKIVPFAMAEEQKKLIKGLEIVKFENSGHGMFIDEDDKLFEELLLFHEEEIGRKVPMQIAA
ncbi:MAG: alpha/beta hydrolase [Candidatus Bathyarchaeota archaeon]|nr:alpha/beta hydrolase [Candidatus Termiticorpusculum sp.]